MKKLSICAVFSLIIIVGCKEKYLPSITSPSTGYLVVEGFISSSLEPTTITLTRTQKLYDSVAIIYEHNAEVNIESENHEIFPLLENGNGQYVSSSLVLNNNEKYHLQIKTSDGKQYVSDFAAVKNTPAIDTISWQRENGGVRIYISTHDPQNNTKYYQWKYEETWEIHSAFETSLKYIVDPSTKKILGVEFRDPQSHAPDTTIYKCWPSDSSTNINIGTSEKLSSDNIYLPLLFIEPAAEKLSVLYSIRVRQFALSHEAYLFFDKIKKNTEQLGSVFDPQPTVLKGNIHCITNPAEPVVGYIEVSEEKDQRIFISNDMLPGWNYSSGCQSIIIDNQPDSIFKYGSGLIPLAPVDYLALAIKTFSASDEFCVECTARGTNVRPTFWP